METTVPLGDWRLPSQSWDTHLHVFDPARHPYPSQRKYSPVPATKDELFNFNVSLTETATPQNIVLVQPSPYGTDNSLILDLLENTAVAEPTMRAIAVIDSPAVSESELDRMNGLGVRGVRINVAASSDATGVDELRRQYVGAARRISKFGNWMCQLYVVGEAWDYLYDTISSLPVKVIADHQGGMRGTSALSAGIDKVQEQPGFASFLNLAKRGKVFIKLSGFYRSSKLTTGGYDDLEPLIRIFASEVPGQLIWGSDWPHTQSAANRSEETKYEPEDFRKVDDVAVLKNIRRWVGPRVWWMMMVETPRRLFQ